MEFQALPCFFPFTEQKLLNCGWKSLWFKYRVVEAIPEKCRILQTWYAPWGGRDILRWSRRLQNKCGGTKISRDFQKSVPLLFFFFFVNQGILLMKRSLFFMPTACPDSSHEVHLKIRGTQIIGKVILINIKWEQSSLVGLKNFNSQLLMKIAIISENLFLYST